MSTCPYTSLLVTAHSLKHTLSAMRRCVRQESRDQAHSGGCLQLLTCSIDQRQGNRSQRRLSTPRTLSGQKALGTFSFRTRIAGLSNECRTKPHTHAALLPIRWCGWPVTATVHKTRQQGSSFELPLVSLVSPSVEFTLPLLLVLGILQRSPEGRGCKRRPQQRTKIAITVYRHE